MFNFFTKTKTDTSKEVLEDKEDNTTVASITYLVKRDGPVIVDVAVEDYDEKSMLSLFSVLDVLSKDKCYVETVNIIKESLLNDGQEELAVLLISHVAKQLTTSNTTKFINTYQEDVKNQPCIKPSDMLK